MPAYRKKYMQLSYEAYPGGPSSATPVRKRPIGLVVIAILQIIGSLLNIAGGGQNLAGGFTLGIVSLVLGLVGLLVGVLMILGRSYTFVLAWLIISLVVGLALGAYTLATLAEFAGTELGGALIGGVVVGLAIGVVLQVIIIYYMLRPHVKAFFGRAPTPQPAAPTVMPPPPPPQPAAQGPFCPSCGAQLQYVQQYQKYWCPSERRYV